MPNRKGIVFVVIGAVLILSALSLYLYNKEEDRNAGQEAESLLLEIQSVINENPTPQPTKPAETVAPDDPAPTPSPEPIDPTLPEVVVQGYSCIGYLSIPTLDLELPVISEWDYVRLQTAPCRQFGSSKTDDLVIAAHNYERHFGKLMNLIEGDSVYFTDMDGNINSYVVRTVETLAPEAVDVIQSRGSALVLYTCTKGGATRVSVFCDRAAEASSETISGYEYG